METYIKDIWSGAEPIISSLNDAAAQQEIREILFRYRGDQRRAAKELLQLSKQFKGKHNGDLWSKFEHYASAQEKCDHPRVRTIDGNRDSDLAEANQSVERVLIGISAGLDELGAGAVGGLPYCISRSRYYADMFRDAVQSLRIGNIETWWSYEQFAVRGMEPALRHIASVGERIERLRTRLQAVKQDILQSSIASQTEATRDNTHRLERIQTELKEITIETRKSSDGINNLRRTYLIFSILYYFTMFAYAAIILYLLLRNLNAI